MRHQLKVAGTLRSCIAEINWVAEEAVIEAWKEALMLCRKEKEDLELEDSIFRVL